VLLTGDAADDLEVMYPYQRLLEERYEVDGNLVTGRAWPDHPPCFRPFMEQLRKIAPVG
jgi:putative intracellular protease/amidase